MSLLTSLAAFAVKNNNTRAVKTPIYELTVEAVRDLVVVVDGNKKQNEDGSQALVVRVGKRGISMEAVAPGCGRVNAPADKVEEFSALILEAVAAGEFDEAIKELQAVTLKAEAERKAKALTPVLSEDDLAGLDELVDGDELAEVADES